MSFERRLELYSEIEAIRGRPLIAYVTSSRPGASGQMAADAVSEILRHVRRLPPEANAVDVLIVSTGGDPTVAWRTISVLRERFSDVGVLIPFHAYSAATLLALGANSIWMHPFANLGPVDAQLTAPPRGVDGRGTGGPPIMFSTEDLTNFLTLVREDVRVTDQKLVLEAFNRFVDEVGPITVGAAKRAQQLSISLGEKLLRTHMQDATAARAIIEKLNFSYFHHGYPVGRAEAKEIGLPVQDPDDRLTELLWAVWEDFEGEMECAAPFNPAEALMQDAAAGAILSRPVDNVALPAGLPPEVLQHAYQHVLANIPIVQIPAVHTDTFNAAIESMNARSHYKTSFMLLSDRKPDLSIGLQVTQVSSGWTHAADVDRMPGGEV